MVRAMQGHRRRLAVIVAAGLLAAPANAVGQSAGDEQYEDPFAGEQQEQSQGGGSEEPSAPVAPTPEPAAPGSTAPGAEPELQPAPESGPAPASQPQLPRTGADTGGIVIAGALLLAGGVALRLRLRDRE
jgi:LPXTG-motif cell wall-anchored protein